MNLPETYLALSDFRKHDIFLPEMNQAQIISDFFPGTFTELTQRLSDITGAFYGGMLKQIGVSCEAFASKEKLPARKSCQLKLTREVIVNHHISTYDGPMGNLLRPAHPATGSGDRSQWQDAKGLFGCQAME